MLGAISPIDRWTQLHQMREVQEIGRVDKGEALNGRRNVDRSSLGEDKGVDHGDYEKRLTDQVHGVHRTARSKKEEKPRTSEPAKTPWSWRPDFTTLTADNDNNGIGWQIAGGTLPDSMAEEERKAPSLEVVAFGKRPETKPAALESDPSFRLVPDGNWNLTPSMLDPQQFLIAA